MNRFTTIAFGLAAALTLSVQAQNQNSGQSQSAANASEDARFVQQALGANLAEIQMGKLAAKSQNSQIRQLGQDLESSHQKELEQLQAIAQNQGFQASPTVSRHYQQQLLQLQQMSGNEFDRQFAVNTLKDHGRAIELFQKEAQQGQNPQLKQYAQTMLPEWQQHYQMTQTAAKDVGVSSKDIAALLREHPTAMGGAATPGGQGQGAQSNPSPQNQSPPPSPQGQP